MTTDALVSATAAWSLGLAAAPSLLSAGGAGGGAADAWLAAAAGREARAFSRAGAPLGRGARGADVLAALAAAPAGVARARLFLAAARAGGLALYDADAGGGGAPLARARDAFDEPAPLFSVAWSLARCAHAWAGADAAVFSFDAARGVALARAPARGRVAALASAPDASGLVAAGALDARGVLLFDERGGGGAVAELADDGGGEGGGGGGGVTCVRFSPCARFLFAGFRRAGAVLRFDLRGSQRVLSRYARDDGAGQRLGFDVDGASVATASRDARVLVYDVEGGALAADLRDWPAPPCDVAALGGGAFAVLAGPRHGGAGGGGGGSGGGGSVSVWERHDACALREAEGVMRVPQSVSQTTN